MRIFFAGLLLVPALAIACGGDDEKKPGGGGSGSCVPTAAECYVSGQSGPGAECLAKHDNTGAAVWQGRFSQITVTKPQKLSNVFVQEEIIDKGINLNQPSCFENGDGTFAWLFSLDPTTNTMRTGGGLPVLDPSAGSCFVTITTTPVEIKPIDVAVAFDGKKFSASGINVNVPIFLKPDQTDNPTILPLHEIAFDATFNDDNHNCIGHYNGDILTTANSCAPDTKAIPPERRWTSGGTITGFITIAEADQVFVEQLSSTLCVFLAGQDWNGPNKDCKSSDKWTAGERPPGDWCSTTNAPGDASCMDAYRLEGEFAASAFPVNGDCP